MVYTEVATIKSRKGKVIESVRDSFEDDIVSEKKTVVRNMNGRVIVYNFSTMTAQHWRPGNPGDRRTTNIVKLDL